jgi:ATP-binding cassette subfamily G (WHITE) protein 2 (PDR)
LSTGVVSGTVLLDGEPLPAGFERNCGYVQQQDLHVETTTVREALQFSAMLRQPQSVPKAEKLEFVESIISTLNMEEFSEAIVGVPGSGLTNKQRKLLSIGVELAAKPSVLLFLDEPTTGLDSESAYGVVSFLRRLADNGMSILCTIHQPTAQMFQQFDRLLLLVKGGRTAYFGDIGGNSETVLDYFGRNGARKYRSHENPSEYVIEVVSQPQADWANVWQMSEEARDSAIELLSLGRRNSSEYETASEHMTALPMAETVETPVETLPAKENDFAISFPQQLFYVTHRVFQQYWRTPQYIWSKIMLACVSSL